MSLSKDIKSTVKMIEDYNSLSDLDKRHHCLPSDSSDFDVYSKVMPFTNENMKMYYKQFNYDGNILTVAASGDSVLHSILMDCNDIVMFDINRLTYYYVFLKLAAVKGLTFGEFKDYFTLDGWPGYPNMHYELFEKFEQYLNQDVKQYWNQMYDMYKTKDYLYFQKGFFFSDGTYSNTDYLTIDNYKKLKENLTNKNRNIEFVNKELLMLDDSILDKKYSSVYLSNILEFIPDTNYFKEFLLEKLSTNLDDNGLVMYNYQWGEADSYKGNNFYEIPCGSEKAFVYRKK